MINRDEIRTRTKDKRKLIGLTQAALAKDAHIDRSVYCQWEGGLLNLSAEQLRRIDESLCAAIKLRLGKLLAEFAEVSV